jgi:hypothetical protein
MRSRQPTPQQNDITRAKLYDIQMVARQHLDYTESCRYGYFLLWFSRSPLFRFSQQVS